MSAIDDIRHTLTNAVRKILTEEHGPEAIVHLDFNGKVVDGNDWGILSYPEPADALQAIPIARWIADIARGLLVQYACDARGQGKTWTDVAKVLLADQPETDDPGHDAFLLIAGPRNPDYPFDEMYVNWRCRSCREFIRDVGPWGGHPDDNERNHIESCKRHAAEVKAYMADWGEE